MELIAREHFTAQEEEAVNSGFREYNASQDQLSMRRPVAFAMYDTDGSVIGALDGYIFFDWLTVSRLWVAPGHRGAGIGSKLMGEAEALARRVGCVGSTLSTYDFQARPFYEKLGYEVFGILPDNPKGHDRFFMRKSL